MRDDLDYSRLAEAVDLVRRGDVLMMEKCTVCQGMSMPGTSAGNPGHCSNCNGGSFVEIERWKSWGMEGKLDYWQARALMAEAKLAGRRRNEDG